MMEALAMPSTNKKKKIEDWEVQSAVDTLIKAEEIKQNEPLMKLVLPEFEKKVSAFKNATKDIEGLREENKKQLRDDLTKELMPSKK